MNIKQRNHKKWLLGCVAAGLLMPATSALATDKASHGPIAVVDMKSIVENSSTFKSMRDDAQKGFEGEHQGIENMQNELKKLYEKLNKNRSTLSKDDLKKLRQDIHVKQESLSTAQADFQQKVLEKQSQLYEQFMKQVRENTALVAKQKGYDYVIVKSAVLVSPEKDDLTAGVMKKLG